MYISREKNYIIPVVYVSGKDLDFLGFHFELMSEPNEGKDVRISDEKHNIDESNDKI